MPIERSYGVNETVTHLTIKWERDDTQDIQSLDYQMVLDTTGDHTRVDVQATFEKIMEEGGCTFEQSREQTARQIARVDAWAKDDWTYIGCTVTAHSVTKTDEGAEIETRELASDSVWGIESFAGASYRSEVVGDLEVQVLAQLTEQGFDIDPDDWNTLERRESASSCYGYPDTDPGENADPLPVLQEDTDDFRFTYDTDDTGTFVKAECLQCGNEMNATDLEMNYSGNHGWDCEKFEEQREEIEQEGL